MVTSGEQIYTVAALTALIKSSLEGGFPAVTVEGEISNCKAATSGHLYFTLKDRDAMIQAVMFRYRFAGLDFEPSDGMRVRLRGAVTVYAARGQYQILGRSMSRVGTGDILAMLEERRRALAAEGLFDESRKRALPRLPGRVGVVTSPTGAAVHDILNVLARRNASVGVVVMPAAVQGQEAPAQIVARIEEANRHGLADVLIVGRGGGSLEDLLAFSDESVVRAVAASGIPVISAVGHEVDWALCDYAADLRAATPSAAAEMVSESGDAIRSELEGFAFQFATSIRSRLDLARIEVSRFEPENVEAQFMRLFLPAARKLDDSVDLLARGVSERLKAAAHRLELSERNLQIASPQAVLERGFAVVRKVGSMLAVREGASLAADEMLDITFAKGSSVARVVEARNEGF